METRVKTRVSEEGNITFPFLSEVKLAGLTTSATEKKISEFIDMMIITSKIYCASALPKWKGRAALSAKAFVELFNHHSVRSGK